MPAISTTVALALLLLLAASQAAAAYPGLDCAQGSAVLRHHTTLGCASELQQHAVGCVRQLALRVQRCALTAWPHPHQHGRKQACGGLQLRANITDVDAAAGELLLHGQRLPALLRYKRADDAMHLALGANCSLAFAAQSVADDASLHPIPGEDARGFLPPLLGLVAAAIAVPCVCAGLIVAAASLGLPPAAAGAAARTPGAVLQQALVRLSSGRLGSSSGDEQGGGGGYVALAGSSSSDAGSSGRPAEAAADAGGLDGAGSSGSARGGLGILRAMSRRARARRLRRSCRPRYVGLPEQSAQSHKDYVAGRLAPGPFRMVAPYFRFPPVAAPSPLDAIAEGEGGGGSCSPSCSSASAASSSSSGCLVDSDDLVLLSPPGRLSPAGAANMAAAWLSPASSLEPHD